MGSEINKVFLDMAGSCVLNHSLTRLSEASFVGQIVVVINHEDRDLVKERLGYDFSRTGPIELVEGGERRQDSSLAGVERATSEYVLVHDAARPNFSIRLVKDLFDAARDNGSALPGISPVDTIRSVTDGEVGSTLDRDSLIRVQTPQCFRREILLESLRAATDREDYFTDDVAVVMAEKGIRPALVEGERGNIKLTRPLDFRLLESLLSKD